jgi:hypothetical protein
MPKKTSNGSVIDSKDEAVTNLLDSIEATYARYKEAACTAKLGHWAPFKSNI